MRLLTVFVAAAAAWLPAIAFAGSLEEAAVNAGVEFNEFGSFRSDSDASPAVLAEPASKRGDLSLRPASPVRSSRDETFLEAYYAPARGVWNSDVPVASQVGGFILAVLETAYLPIALLWSTLVGAWG